MKSGGALPPHLAKWRGDCPLCPPCSLPLQLELNCIASRNQPSKTKVAQYKSLLSLSSFKTVIHIGCFTCKGGCDACMCIRHLKEELTWAIDKWFQFICNAANTSFINEEIKHKALKQYCKYRNVVFSSRIPWFNCDTM